MLDLSCRSAYQAPSRSRHSVALLHNLAQCNPLTPQSSLPGRPPSVASCRYSYVSQTNPANSVRYPQYLFGEAPCKSESTLNVLPNNSASPNHSGLKSHYLKMIQENDGENERNNHHSDTRSTTKPNQADHKSVKDLASPFPNKCSVRKCGSDASTFYTRKNLKRSQIAHSQLSSILYSNFYIKKFAPTHSGSQVTLLSPDSTENGTKDGFAFSNLSARHLSYDFGNHSPQIGSSHVYLPNVPNALLDANRSISCNQLNTGHYHNHLLGRQSMRMHSEDRTSLVDKGG